MILELPRRIRTKKTASSRIGRRGSGWSSKRRPEVVVEPGLCGQNEAAGRGGTAAAPGGGLAPAAAPYVELGFQGLGWRWRGYSGEVPGYRGARGGGDGWWRGSGAASATGRGEGADPSGGGRTRGEEVRRAEEDIATRRRTGCSHADWSHNKVTYTIGQTFHINAH
jgi:hypothetical protein